MSNSALDKQVGGDHYKKFPIQPAEFCYINDIPYLEATAIKYLCRWRDKGGFADLDKAIHFIELVKELELKYKKEQQWRDYESSTERTVGSGPYTDAGL